MPKEKISITIDSDTLRIIETLLNNPRFRNRSHIIEYSLKNFLENLEGKE